MATVGALKAGHHAKEIASELKNICVCGTYARVNKAIQGL